jgi:hypothetical protein
VSRSDLTPAMRAALLVAAQGGAVWHGTAVKHALRRRGLLARTRIGLDHKPHWRATDAGIDVLRALVSP